MKQLKTASWNAINRNTTNNINLKLTEYDNKMLTKYTQHLRKKNEIYENGIATFYEVMSDIPKFLQSKIQEENLSIPLAFSAVLHLANEHNLRFIPTDEPYDFKIIKIANVIATTAASANTTATSNKSS